MKIRRIDSYEDDRFSRTVLVQHGAYLVEEEPYEIEIMNASEAVIRGKDPSVFPALIGEFRFHAPHIIRFFDESGLLAASYPAQEILEIPLERIQPSQFFIDEEKLRAIRTFVHRPEDIVIQVIPWGDRFVSLDGHTRLYFAVQNGFRSVRAVVSETDDWVWPFVHEAEKRDIFHPGDMILLTHGQYEIQWNRYCDTVFAREQPPMAPVRGGTPVILKVGKGSRLADMLLEYAENCSWTEARDHIAGMIRSWAFTDWETMFTAIMDGKIIGMTSVMKTDYYPLPDICPWVSCIFVSEEYRGHKISGELIASANRYLKKKGFSRSYIPSECTGLYEHYGYACVRDIVNYGGGTDHLYMKDLS